VSRRVTLYTRVGCHLCARARELLEGLRRETPFDLEVDDIDADESLRVRYNESVPVIAVDGEEVFWGIVDERALAARLKRTD
jgi:glutaredoxin